jgi:hypothetical protein
VPELFRTRLNGYCLLLARDGLGWRAYRDDTHSTYGHSSPNPRSMEEWVRDVAHGTPPVAIEFLGAGEYYARMWRGGAWPNVKETRHSREWLHSVRVTRMLTRRLKAVFDAIEPVRAHDGVYSHELRMLLLLACNEVESSCKAILVEHGVQPMGSWFNMKDYRKLAPVMRLDEWAVTLTTNPDYGPIEPFARWSATPTSTLEWFQEHHEVKHDRETKLARASFGNAIVAVAAAYVMRVAQFGLSFGELFTGDVDEFEHVREPAWSDVERYVAPSAPQAKSPLLQGPPIPKRHPAL